MITSQFSLGGAHGTYPIYDFTFEDNYERPSQLVVKTDEKLVDVLSSETFMQFYYLDNKLFEGIPIYGNVNNDELELTLIDKISSLWTVGGFALDNGSGDLNYKNESAFNIVSNILNGSQFYCSEDTIPQNLVSISGTWQTKPDFLYAIAKQITDTEGNMSTVWVDNKNYVHIGSLNADKTINLSTKISNISSQDVNFIKFNGAIVQGGKTELGENVLESSILEQTYNEYHLDNKIADSFNVVNNPSNINAKIALTTSGNHRIIKIGFDKANTAPIMTWWGDPVVNNVRQGDFFTHEVTLQEKSAFFNYDEIDLAYMIWFDSESNNSIDTWIPQSYYRQTSSLEYPQYAGMPYSYLKSISAGFMDSNGNPVVEITMEKYAAGIYSRKSSQYSTTNYPISDIAKIRFYVNMDKYTESIAYPDPSSRDTTPTAPAPVEIPYWANRNYAYLFRFKSRIDGWKLQVIRTNIGNVPGATWLPIVKTAGLDYLFNGSNTFPDGTPAVEITGGGYPFIKAKLQTNVEKALINDAWHFSQIYGVNGKIPLVVGLPQKTVSHKPYLFHSDASIKHKSQAKAIAQNIFNDYQKVVNADIEIDPMAYYYPSDPVNRFGVGWNVHLEVPSKLVGDYRIRSITATPDRVSISLKNRNVNLSETIDKIQKQIKEVTS